MEQNFCADPPVIRGVKARPHQRQWAFAEAWLIPQPIRSHRFAAGAWIWVVVVGAEAVSIRSIVAKQRPFYNSSGRRRCGFNEIRGVMSESRLMERCITRIRGGSGSGYGKPLLAQHRRGFLFRVEEDCADAITLLSFVATCAARTTGWR